VSAAATPEDAGTPAGADTPVRVDPPPGAAAPADAVTDPADAAMHPTSPVAGHAIVTGAGRGIGRACAVELAACGLHVSAIARTAADLHDLVAEIEAAGGTARALVADVAVAREIRGAVAEAARDRHVDLLVTAAGTNRPGPAVDLAEEDLDLLLDANVRGTFLACQAVAREWIPAGRPGRIVALSSQMGTVGYPGRAAYCATKHAVNGLVKALAVEWAPHGILVNAVAPTFVRTPMTAPMLADPAFRDEVLTRIPLGRVGDVRDVTGAVRFLASPAAGLVTGHVLAVDGGWTAW